MNEQQLRDILSTIIEDEKIFIYHIEIKPNNVFQIFLDGDEGIPINAIASINRKLYKKIEELAGYEDGNFALEVSSPGVDMPLLFTRQYNKHIGRNLEIIKQDDTEIVGKLLDVEDDSINIEIVVDKKKKIIENIKLPFEAIKKATVQLQF